MADKKPDTALELRHESGMARPEPSLGHMMQAVVEKGVTPDNADALCKLAGEFRLMEEWKDRRNAEKEFAAAFNALQGEMPIITAKTIIPNRGKYEKFEDLMKVIGPFLVKNGFTVSFSMDFKENRILETCHLKHIGGHSQSNSFAVRSGRADSDTQADCKAATTAKRNALCNALNIVIRQDVLNEEHDAAMEGDPNAKVTTEQAEELERRAQLTNSNIPAFLAFTKSKKFADIPANRYDELDAMLRRKEQTGR